MNVAIVILTDGKSEEGLGRAVNALVAAKEFQQAGDEVRIIFDGAGSRCLCAIADSEHQYHKLLADVRENVQGVCKYCASAYGVEEGVKAAGMPLLDDYNGHPSFRKLLAEGWQLLTF